MCHVHATHMNTIEMRRNAHKCNASKSNVMTQEIGEKVLKKMSINNDDDIQKLA